MLFFLTLFFDTLPFDKTTLLGFESLGITDQLYQLMNEDFPAEWFPINMIVIFLRGANNLKPRFWAMLTYIRKIILKIYFEISFNFLIKSWYLVLPTFDIKKNKLKIFKKLSVDQNKKIKIDLQWWLNYL